MRQLVIDTETTGLDPRDGHRIIEFAALELVDRRPTGRAVHLHFDPEREVDAGATEVHGKTWEDLKGQPRFRDRVVEIVEFVRGAQWVIHNAPFDLAFIDVELGLLEQPPTAALHDGVIDTLALAREIFPGKRNNLDALCERFGVSNAQRTLHGALLDAQLLAEVYLAMTRGQESLTIDMGERGGVAALVLPSAAAGQAIVAVIAPTAEEAAAHEAYLDALDRETRGRCLWRATT
ncbi:MAG: DNA polymerase III subunit epsilon [Burkholderiales bacterium]|nr:DNA polymerase III subunit epsilon [Burkholderiales bacterium]